MSTSSPYLRRRKSTTSRAIRGVVAMVVAVASLVTFAATPAYAADTVVIRKVDTSDASNITLTVLKPPVSGDDDAIKVSENDKSVTPTSVQTATEAGLPIGIALVIDNSSASASDDALTKMKEAAKEMIASAPSSQQFAVVATHGTGRTISPFTNNRDALIASIDTLQASNDNAQWNAAQLAAGLLQNSPDLQANLVLMASSPDKVSTDGRFTDLRSQLRAANAVAFTVGIAGRNGLDEENLRDLAQSTGGRYISTKDPSTVTQILAGIQSNLADQAIIKYRSLGGETLDISVQIGNGVATAHTSLGTVAEGASVTPAVVAKSKAPLLGGTSGLIIVGGISLLCVGLLLYGIIELVGNERNQLSKALRPYSEDEVETSDVSKLADSQIIKKAVAATAKAAEERGLLQIVQTRLEQADLPLKPAEALFFTGALALVAMIIGAAFFNFIGIAVAALLFMALPIMVTGALAKRRRKKFTSQLPDTLQLLAGSLRAGYSLVQGLDAVSKQCEAPMSTELLRAMAESRLGRPIEESLQEISDRMGSDDFEWAVMAIKIQREVGGNLAELLMTVSETMIGRERLRREVRGLTAEGRISAIVLSALPFAIGAIIMVMNPSYMEPLLSSAIGQMALVGAVVMIGVGYWLMMKMIEIEA